MKHNRRTELDSLLSLAERTKVLREIRVESSCGLSVVVQPDGNLISKGRSPTGNLRNEVERLLHIGDVKITANHGVAGRIVFLGVSALLS